MKLLFIPNWNGHLYLSEKNDNSVIKIYNDVIKNVHKLNINNVELLKVEKNNMNLTNRIIEKKYIYEINMNNENNQKNKIISITGDHSNTFPLFKAFSKNNKEPKLIIFDAHPDVEISTDCISHEDYLRNLIEKNIIKPENIYLFGIRTFSRTEFEYLENKKINYFTITDILKNKTKIKEILKLINGNIYLSLDIDVLDPDFAPGTYYKEWCGLNINELLEFISIIKDKVNNIDICEYFSENDENNITLNNILKIIK